MGKYWGLYEWWYYGVFQGCTTRDGTGGDTGNDTRVLLGVVLGVVQGEV